MHRFALGAAIIVGLAAPRGSAATRVCAEHLHDGLGSPAGPARVTLDGGSITRVERGAFEGSGRCDIEVPWLTPGLVAALPRPVELVDPESVSFDRRAVDLATSLPSPESLVARGITSLSATPGDDRLVGGRAGLLRVHGSLLRPHLRDGALHAVLDESALWPPDIFEPNLRINADNPHAPAAPQRPQSEMAAVAGLRRVLASDDAAPIRSGNELLRIRARRESDIRHARDLAREAGARLVLDGADEAWRLDDDWRGITIVLGHDSAGPADEPALSRHPEAAKLLAGRGGVIALDVPLVRGHADPLLGAALLVRHGLSEPDAIAAITGRAALAVGAADVGVVQAGAVADLVGFDVPPLESRARPRFVLVAGVDRDVRTARDADESVLVLRAGTIRSGDRIVREGTLTITGDRVTSLSPGRAAPSGAEVLDFGPDAVIVPGFLDAFSHCGLTPGPAVAGNSRLRAADAVEPGATSLPHALAAGVTSALVAPATTGPVAGQSCLIGIASAVVEAREDESDVLAELPPLDAVVILRADAGLVTWLDGGPDDVGQRATRVKVLAEILAKAKSYHEARSEQVKKDGKSRKRDRPGRPAEEKKPLVPEPMMEPWRDAFAGKSKVFLRAGRRDSILAGLDAFKAAGLVPILVGGEEADLVADELKSRGVAVVLGPSALRRDSGELVSVAAVLRSKGVDIAHGSFSRDAHQLPLTLLAAVRQGLSPEDALASVTHAAARIVGLDEAAGRLDAGSLADAVVYGGDPFEPASRILAVVAAGRVVIGGPP